MIYQLMYFSQAAENLTAADVEAILDVANVANPRHGITGFLTFNGQEFIQFMEGPMPAVERLLANIERDPRNEALITLTVHETVQRSFPDWRMVRLPGAPVRNSAAAVDYHHSAPEIAAAIDSLNSRFRESYRAYLAA